MIENERLVFEVNAEQLSFKDVIKKDFLSIDMYPISDENPNNNGSHFTIESLHNSLSSFISKPVVGFFTSQNDFESHKGKWVKDRETGVKFYSTRSK